MAMIWKDGQQHWKYGESCLLPAQRFSLQKGGSHCHMTLSDWTETDMYLGDWH